MRVYWCSDTVRPLSSRYIADILKWQAVLFGIFSERKLTREEAQILSNAEAILLLPEGERYAANEALEAFCVAFNDTFPMVELIYECQPNPFLTSQGQVNLGGGSEAVGMTRDTPVAFSLPSIIPGQLDAQGLCTIRILNELQASHNELYGKLRRFASDVTREEVDETLAPSLSHGSSPELMSRQLIVYDRRWLLSVIQTHAQGASVASGTSAEVAYDFDQIQRTIKNSLLSGKLPIVIQITHVGL